MGPGGEDQLHSVTLLSEVELGPWDACLPGLGHVHTLSDPAQARPLRGVTCPAAMSPLLHA